MNIIEAKAILLQKLVEHLGGRYSHTDRKGILWYFSVFRPDEKTASFTIDEKLNRWHDYGLSNTFAHRMQGSGGDTVDLWCDYHLIDRRLGIPQALTGLKQFGHSAIHGERLQQQETKEEPAVQNKEPQYKIIEIKDRITFWGLQHELERRRISIELAERYLKQGHLLDNITGKHLTCFLFENDKGGFEASIPNPSKNKCFKTCIGPKASTRLMASDDHHDADVFEGFFDFLAWLEIHDYQRHMNHTYVLNSVSMVKEVSDKIIAFKEAITDVFLFMDNDKAGRDATQALITSLSAEKIKAGSYSEVYKERKDLSEYWSKGPAADEFKFDL